MSSKNNNINTKNNYNDINLKEPMIQSTPYTISNNINPNIIISSKNNSNEYHNYNSILKEKVNNLNNISKELLSNIDSDNSLSINTKNNNSKKNNKSNNEKREIIDINDIGKILGGNIEKDDNYDNYYFDDNNNINYNGNNKNEMNNNLYQNSINNSNMYIQLKNENEKLQKENIYLKQELTNTINSLKQIEYKLHSLQSKLELYEASLENTKTQYEDQINKYQNQITKYEDIITIVNSFFNNIDNKFSLNLNLSNNNVMNGINFEENLQTIEKYILDLNNEIKNYRLILENNSFNNLQNLNQADLSNIKLKDSYLYNKNNFNNINDFVFKENINESKKLNINKYNFNYEDKKNNDINNNNNGNILNNNDEESKYINNNNEDINLNNQNYSNYQQNFINNNNKDYKLLEQRVMMLEKELKFQQNAYPHNESDPRLNYFTYNNKEDERNGIIFQNDIIAERMRSSSKGSYDRIKENKKGHKIKKKKRKMMIDKLEDQQNKDKSDIISNSNNYRTFIINKEKTNRKVNSRIKSRK